MKKQLLLLSTLMLLTSCMGPLPTTSNTPTSEPTSNPTTTTTTNPTSDPTSEPLSSTRDPYYDWLESEKASDYNEDGQINEDDYAIYVDFVVWKESDDASDYNGDRKINISDYILMINYNEWYSSDDAMDLDDNRKVTIDDYFIYLDYVAWEESEDAYDYTGDSRVTIDDYLYFIGEGFESFNAWLESEDAQDFNNDKTIDFLDYEIWTAYLAWKDSNKAEDLNNDRTINFSDYDLYLNPTTDEYKIWLSSLNAKDYNGDGITDRKDYEHFLLFGEYKFDKVELSGYDWALTEDMSVTLSGLVSNLSLIKLFVDENGTSYSLEDGIKLSKTVQDAFDTIVIKRESKVLIYIDFSFTITSINKEVPVRLHLSDKGTGKYECNYTFEEGSVYTDIAFTISKVA